MIGPQLSSPPPSDGSLEPPPLYLRGGCDSHQKPSAAAVENEDNPIAAEVSPLFSDDADRDFAAIITSMLR